MCKLNFVICTSIRFIIFFEMIEIEFVELLLIVSMIVYQIRMKNLKKKKNKNDFS